VRFDMGELQQPIQCGPPRAKTGRMQIIALRFAAIQILLACPLIGPPAAAASPPAGATVLVEIENRVEIQRAGARVWDPGTTNQILFPGDRLRTGERSRAVLRLSDLTLVRLGELGLTRRVPPGSGCSEGFITSSTATTRISVGSARQRLPPSSGARISSWTFPRTTLP